MLTSTKIKRKRNEIENYIRTNFEVHVPRLQDLYEELIQLEREQAEEEITNYHLFERQYND